jgi:hypothetical protein
MAGKRPRPKPAGRRKAMAQVVVMLQIVLFSLQIVDLSMRLIHERGIAHGWRNKIWHKLWMRVTRRTHIRR